MSDHTHFIDEAKSHLDKLGVELDELDQKVKTECRNAGAWYGEQMTKLRSDWQDASTKIEKVAAEAQSEARTSYETAKGEAERHYKALQAAVQTYREEVERNVGTS